MQYELKSQGKRHPLKLAAAVFVLLLGLAALFVSFSMGETYKIIMSMIFVALGIWGIALQFNSIVKSLSFNNVNFTFEDRTFTYQQIEKVQIHGGRYGEVYYGIFVGGEKIYTFEASYQGAREFLFYLDYYKVPMEHYSVGRR